MTITRDSDPCKCEVLIEGSIVDLSRFNPNNELDGEYYERLLLGGFTNRARARKFFNFHLCLELPVRVVLFITCIFTIIHIYKGKPLHESAAAAFLLVYYIIYWICQKSQTSLGAGRDCV